MCTEMHTPARIQSLPFLAVFYFSWNGMLIVPLYRVGRSTPSEGNPEFNVRFGLQQTGWGMHTVWTVMQYITGYPPLWSIYPHLGLLGRLHVQ
jgi:hypothetical protein